MIKTIMICFVCLIVPNISNICSDIELNSQPIEFEKIIINTFFIDENFHSQEFCLLPKKDDFIQIFYFDSNGYVVKSLLPLRHGFIIYMKNKEPDSSLYSQILLNADINDVIEYYYGRYFCNPNNKIYMIFDRIRKVKYKRLGDMFSTNKQLVFKKISCKYDTLSFIGFDESKICLEYNKKKYLQENIEDPSGHYFPYIINRK